MPRTPMDLTTLNDTAEAVAKILGYTVHKPSPIGDDLYYLRRTLNGITYEMGFSSTYHDSKRTRISIYGVWPRSATQACTLFPDSKDRPGSISVARTKTPAQIAKDINSRFIPGFLTAFKRGIEERDSHDNGLAEQLSLSKELAALLITTPYDYNPTQFQGGVPGDGFVRGKVNFGGSVELTITGLSVEKAKKIIAVATGRD